MRGVARAAAAAVAVLFLGGFIALGSWQVERRAWKLDLIERVGQRVHAPAVAAPGSASWPDVSAARDEFRHVSVTGTFLHDQETLVQAVTTLGGGFWVLTPLRQSDGRVVLVNRGFVPPEARGRAARSASEPVGETTITGLLRMTEPKGGFMRSNDSASGRWYSRDVQMIAAARGLAEVAPFFIDADATPSAGERDWPVGGLTVITFQNNHLVYALTWYTLALMVAGAAWRFWRQGPKGRARPRLPPVGD